MVILNKNTTLPLIIIIVIALISQTNSTAYFTYYDNTTNAASVPGYVTLNKSTCASAPVTRLGLCNSTCLICVATDPTKCATCDQGFYLDGTSCMINQTNYKYSNFSYIGTTLNDASSTITNFRYTASNASLTTNMIVSICASTYQIIAAGIYQSTDIINLQFFRQDPIDQIQIKLNFISLVSSAAFFITLNDNIIYSKTFTSLSDLNGIYVQNTNTSQRSFLYLQSLAKDTASAIFIPIDTTLTKYITSTYNIKFYVKTNSTNKYIWLMNDVTVFQRDCQTCVTQAVQRLINSTSLAVLFTILAVILLIIILCIAMAYQEVQNKNEFQQKLGSSSGNLPVKAIDRVIKAVISAKTERNKEINKQYRECQKVLKNFMPLQTMEFNRASKIMNMSRIDSLNLMKLQ